MKKLIVFLVIAMSVVLSAYSQEEGTVDSKQHRKLTKEEKMALRKAESAVIAQMVDSLIKNRRFVLEANYLSNQTGNRQIVNGLINFIIVDSSNILIQTASTTGIGGYNGMGGVTTRGSISTFEVKKTGKNEDSYYIRVLANTTIGPYDIFFTISPDSNTNATISGIRSGKLNYHGVIKPIESSKVFKGMTI